MLRFERVCDTFGNQLTKNTYNGEEINMFIPDLTPVRSSLLQYTLEFLHNKRLLKVDTVC